MKTWDECFENSAKNWRSKKVRFDDGQRKRSKEYGWGTIKYRGSKIWKGAAKKMKSKKFLCFCRTRGFYGISRGRNFVVMELWQMQNIHNVIVHSVRLWIWCVPNHFENKHEPPSKDLLFIKGCVIIPGWAFQWLVIPRSLILTLFRLASGWNL